MAERVEVQLGDKVRDTLTGYEGVVTGIYIYLHGCRRIGISPATTDKEGKIRDDGWTIDEPRLEIVEAGFYKTENEAGEEGGPDAYGADAG